MNKNTMPEDKLEITQHDDGYILSWMVHELEDPPRYKIYRRPIEDTKNEDHTLKKLLYAVAEHFGYEYNKFAKDNLSIKWNKKGHKYYKPEPESKTERSYTPTMCPECNYPCVVHIDNTISCGDPEGIL